jgi:uncharacterized paraquat-inducible protein A
MPIRVVCPSCGASANAPDSAAGKRVRCPKCQAVMSVPADESAEADADEVEPAAPRVMESSRSRPSSESRRRDPTDEDEGDQRSSVRRRRRIRCPFCDSEAPPREAQEVSQAGLIVMVVLILTCLPLFWIPLISMKETKLYCSDCGSKLGG